MVTITFSTSLTPRVIRKRLQFKIEYDMAINYTQSFIHSAGMLESTRFEP